MTVHELPRPASLTEFVASRIRGLMAERRARQLDLAELLGVSQAAVSRRMSGRSEFSVSELGAIADWLGVHPAEFFGPARRGPGAEWAAWDSNPEPTG